MVGHKLSPTHYKTNTFYTTTTKEYKATATTVETMILKNLNKKGWCSLLMLITMMRKLLCVECTGWQDEDAAVESCSSRLVLFTTEWLTKKEKWKKRANKRQHNYSSNVNVKRTGDFPSHCFTTTRSLYTRVISIYVCCRWWWWWSFLSQG